MSRAENKDFDIIISNPPYGPIGCEVTKRIIDEINFKEFVNLLPANDYIKRGKKYNLWQYVENVKKMFPVRDFDDAAVTSHCAKIQKTPNLFLSAEEFEIENFIDPQMTKFFYENKNRKHCAIKDIPTIVNLKDNNDVDYTILLGHRDVNHGHLAYSKRQEYMWNTEKSINNDDLKGIYGDKTNKYIITFKTKTEKENFAKFMYSEDGFRFYSKIFTAANVDSTISLEKILPKVDWTKEWTVEEILKDYGYSKKEIKEVMEDLKNFKGMVI